MRNAHGPRNWQYELFVVHRRSICNVSFSPNAVSTGTKTLQKINYYRQGVIFCFKVLV